MKLTKDQSIFLSHHGIKVEDTFDATGFAFNEWKILIRDHGKKIAFGVTPCKNGGHTLRSKYNQCIQCHPEFLAYSNRFNSNGHIYIAYSHEKKYIKIGITKNIKNRANSLRSEVYGNCSDWVISYSCEISEALGKIELVVHQKLRASQVKVEYLKDGRLQSANELFEFPVEKAIKIIKSSIVECNS